MDSDSSNFTSSPAIAPATAAGRFVLLRHEMAESCGRGSHWDLMLEIGAVLRTWALPCELTSEREASSSESGPAIALADHRLEYLEYEGPVSGKRGFVIRRAAGTHASIISARGSWRVVLQGACLCGELTLETGDAAQNCAWRWSPRPTSAVASGD